MEIESGFGDPESKKRPCSMNRGVPSPEETKKKEYVNIFRGPNIVSPQMEVSLEQRCPKG